MEEGKEKEEGGGKQCWVVTRYKVTRYCNTLLLGVTSPVTLLLARRNVVSN